MLAWPLTRVHLIVVNKAAGPWLNLWSCWLNLIEGSSGALPQRGFEQRLWPGRLGKLRVLWGSSRVQLGWSCGQGPASDLGCAASVRRLSSPGPVPPASPRCHHAGAAFTKTEGKPSLPPLTLPRPRPAEGDCCTLPTQLAVKEPLGTAASAWSSVVASAYSSHAGHPPPPCVPL